MQKDQLKKYLKNQLLIITIRHKLQVDDTRAKLIDVLDIATKIDLSETVIGEIRNKRDECTNVMNGLERIIEDVWAITWQNEEIIKRYIDCTDDEIGKLPNEIKNV